MSFAEAGERVVGRLDSRARAFVLIGRYHPFNSNDRDHRVFYEYSKLPFLFAIEAIRSLRRLPSLCCGGNAVISLPFEFNRRLFNDMFPSCLLSPVRLADMREPTSRSRFAGVFRKRLAELPLISVKGGTAGFVKCRLLTQVSFGTL